MGSTLKTFRQKTLINLNDFIDQVNVAGVRYQNVFINSTINDAIAHYVRVLNSFYQGYSSTTITVSAIANTNQYALPATFRSPAYEVRRTINNVDYPLDPVLPYHTTIPTTPVDNTTWLPHFWFEGNNIVFDQYPASSESNAISIKFQAKPTQLSSDTDALPDQYYDIEDCIVLRTTVRSLRTKDVSGALKNISGWEQELIEAERVMMMQVGNRYIKPDRPIPVGEDNYFYI